MLVVNFVSWLKVRMHLQFSLTVKAAAEIEKEIKLKDTKRPNDFIGSAESRRLAVRLG